MTHSMAVDDLNKQTPPPTTDTGSLTFANGSGTSTLVSEERYQRSQSRPTNNRSKQNRKMRTDFRVQLCAPLLEKIYSLVHLLMSQLLLEALLPHPDVKRVNVI